MKSQVLTIEQMKELEALGVDISNASMCWLKFGDGNEVLPYSKTFKECYGKDTIPSVIIPTFTLQDIMSILDTTKHLVVFSDMTDFWAEEPDSDEKIHAEVSSSNVLENAFYMLKWVKQNGYI